MSTGAGPFTYYQTLSGGKRRRTPQPSTTGAAASKAERAHRIDAYLQLLTTLHHQEFAPLEPPVADLPPTASLPEVREQVRHELRAEVAWYDVPGRLRARRAADREAARRHADLVAEAQASQREQQGLLDDQWRRFTDGELEVVLEVLNGAFEDNLAPAAAIGLEDGEAQLAVLVPGEDAVPARKPGVTAAGNVSLRQMNQTQTAEIHRALVAGHVLATVKEAFAVAPQLTGAAVVALRDDGPDVYGADRARPLLAVRFARADLVGVRWREVAAWDVVEQASTDLRVDLYGRTGALEPLDLSEEPELEELVQSVNWE